MEAGVAAAYAVETAIEGAVGAGIAVARPTLPLKAKWTRIPTDVTYPVSSHTLSIVKGKAYIFGGEKGPRELVENDVHVFTLPQLEHDAVDYQKVPATASKDSAVPASRFGHSASVVDSRIYLFGGAEKSEPLEEKGRVWVFDTQIKQWSFLDPAEGSPYPDARVYHASCATEHPSSAGHDQTDDPVGSQGSGFDDHGTIFIHAGFTMKGAQSDLWTFDIPSRIWRKHADAPGSARGGAGLIFAQDRIYRFGGCDGAKELGGPVDVLRFASATFDDKGGKGELAITSRGEWESVGKSSDDEPSPRSVFGFQAITTGQGRNYLLAFLGEREPGTGLESAGKFLDDAWVFQTVPEGMTAGALKDATRMVVGAKNYEYIWSRLELPDANPKDIETPGPRSWFGSSLGQDFGADRVVLWGGLREDNTRAGDGYILSIES